MPETEGFTLFISYERRDSGGWSLLLYDQLRARFGDGVVFRDNQELRSGEKWQTSLKRKVADCRGFILVIGPDWHEPRVLRKLRDPEGWVRREIETAFALHKDIFPVLVGGAAAPPGEKLPEKIGRAIAESNHFHFHDGPTWQQDLDRLCVDSEARTRVVRPVIDVSWEDATAYAEWLSAQTGIRYRLPSEAEWEYAARAGTGTDYWWGQDVQQDGKVWANCAGCGSAWDGKQTAPVGSFAANPFGLQDTAGNVWEWVQDCWHENYAAAPADGQAWLEANSGNCSLRVLRGGSWSSEPGIVRASNRFGNATDARFSILGFRLAQDLD